MQPDNKNQQSDLNDAGEYTLGQQHFLKWLQWAAIIASFIAMMYVMHG
ncbi:Hypothetical protein LUCI_4186 [Lucifera butyrica]|uniref:Uncharacterized protein n=1 Tax=Lucifera butyrica TaxID=1351585 RepID=A0A498RFN4_9FIRM|nr:hypothetical protein [Lucifera butyrica]VBB08903.1 Hypothetical protein LUCI_4186 [Lucifera butyrica]